MLVTVLVPAVAPTVFRFRVTWVGSVYVMLLTVTPETAPAIRRRHVSLAMLAGVS